METSCARNSLCACCKPACNAACSLNNVSLRRFETLIWLSNLAR